jgi:hypothetical protein
MYNIEFVECKVCGENTVHIMKKLTIIGTSKPGIKKLCMTIVL